MMKEHGQNTDNFRKMAVGENLNDVQVADFLVEPMGVEPTTS